MSSVVEEIKSRLNIVDVIRSYTTLEQAGGNFKARCPFHNERSASFFVSPSRQTYHCFGCDRGGDMFSFVEEIEGLDFSGALKVLAERAGVELTRQSVHEKEEHKERDILYRALDLATKFYEAVLPKFPDVVEYVHRRGISDETIKNFRIGFAPDEWRALSDFLKKKGIPEAVSEKAGLIVRSQKGFYDRFRGRVMFPLTDMSGRVIAFSGRILREGDAGKTLGASADAKYVNSPETEVFHKSRVLFGFFEAKHEMRRQDAVVLVEGQMDLILSHQAGATNTVASSGTALTREHLSYIKRFTNNIILALDADTAGLAATQRAIELALDQDMNVRVAALPKGLDPADVVLKDPKVWHDAIKNAKHVIDFYLDLLPELYPDASALRAHVSKIVVPFIAGLRSTIDQGHYVGRVAKLLAVKDEFIWTEVKHHGNDALARTAKALPKGPDVSSRKIRIAQMIQGVFLWQAQGDIPGAYSMAEHRTRFDDLVREGALEGAMDSPPEGDGKLIFEAELRFKGTNSFEEEMEELLKNLEDEILREQFTKKMEELKKAEDRGDIESAQKILAECQGLSKKIHVTKNF